jgi:hypothetical protein
LHPDIETALLNWWEAEQRVRSAAWTRFQGEVRKNEHTRIRCAAGEALAELFDTIEANTQVVRPLMTFEDTAPCSEDPFDGYGA